MRQYLAALVLCFVIPASHAAAVSGRGTWETTLQARDFDGNPATIEGYYDTVLGITWLNPLTTGTPKDWAYAQSVVSSLNVNGIGGWRMPIVQPIDGTTADDVNNFAPDGSEDYGYNVSAPGTLYAGSTASEMAHLFYNTLGNVAQFDTTGAQRTGTAATDWGLINTGPFNVIQPSTPGNTGGVYWSQTLVEGLLTNSNYHWTFQFYNGNQAYSRPTSTHYVWAVHDGSVGNAIAPVPVPAAAWLLLSGLAGLGFVGRRKAH